MTVVYTPKDAVLDTVAIILLLLPEPTTTAMGIALLARPRGKDTPKHPELVHVYRHYPEYQYKVQNIRGREITWEVRTFMPGQLPMSDPNRPVINIKPREHAVYSVRQMPASSQSPSHRLPPGVKIHHEIYRPSPIPLEGPNVYVPGETIHHIRREIPRVPAVNRKQPARYIHHTIENSPAYIKAQSSGIPQSKPTIIHHTVQDSPAVRSGNPAGIVKPVRIVEHHELNNVRPININGRLVRPPSSPALRPQITGRNPKSGSRP